MNSELSPATPAISFRNRLRGLSIRSRVMFLAIVMLVVIVCTGYALLTVLKGNVAVVNRDTKLFTTLQAANAAVRTFGELKYWLTDLAVSQLVTSERNAAEAERRFRENLGQLRNADAAAVAAIEADLESLIKNTNDASDAYADGRRVVGNSLMAQARQHFGKIDARLAELAANAREVVLASSDQAFLLLAAVFLLALAVGVFITLGVLRSVSRPLRLMQEAVVSLTAGKLDVKIPTDAPGEVAAVARALELFRDGVSERNRLAEAERKQRQTLADAIETIGEGFALFDADGRLTVSNTRLGEIFPKSAHVLLPGTSYDDILRSIARDSGAAGENVEDWLAQQTRLREAKVHVRAIGYGDSRWVHVNERQSAAGETVVVFLDITEHMRREMELSAARDLAEAANVSKSQFIANMSHELRTPLNAIIGYSEMLKDETEGLVDPEVLSDLDKIRSAGKHLLALINDVLDLSKIEAGKMKLEFEQVDLIALLDEVASTVKPMLDRNNNRFELERPGSLEPLWADGMRLKQCLLNLLSNASKFTQGGTVTLAARREPGAEGEFVVLEVRDTGIGIPPEKLDRLFQQFSQVDASTTRKYGGTGLGLAISRHFCRLMGGDILVTSTPDVGSVFSIRLPIRGAEQTAEPAGSSPAVPALKQLQEVPSPNLGGTILVIDDSENDRVLLRRYLEREGFDVLTAATGVEGLELLRKHHPVAVTLDIKMDYVDGWTVLAAIRGDAALANTPVIMVSILNEAERSKMMGAAGFLAKPVDRDQLIPLLEHLTGGAPARQALVVDDDEASRTVLRRTLEARGWEVQEATDGRQALLAVGEVRPDLIFLDLMMPEADGFQVLDSLRASPVTADIPVLVVTAKDLTDAERLRLSHGVVGVLQKGAYSRQDVARVVNATKQALAERDSAGLLEQQEA